MAPRRMIFEPVDEVGVTCTVAPMCREEPKWYYRTDGHRWEGGATCATHRGQANYEELVYQESERSA